MGNSNIVPGNAGDDREIIRYLTGRYDDTFYVDEHIKGGFKSDGDEYYCHSDRYPNDRFVVYAYPDGRKQDDYFGLLIKDEFYGMVDAPVGRAFNDYKLYVSFKANYFDVDTSEEKTLAERIQENPYQYMADAIIFTDDTQARASEEALQEAVSALSSLGINCYVAWYCIPQEDYTAMAEDNYEEYLQAHYDLSPDFSANS